MNPDSPKFKRLIGTFLLGCLLFNYPILSLFNRTAVSPGIPLLFLYIFVSWAVIITLIALFSRSDKNHS